MRTPERTAEPRKRQWAWLFGFGVCLLVALLVGNDVRRVAATLLRIRFAALAVVAAHLPVTFTAGVGWRVLLRRDQRPGHLRTFRLRLIKEAVNALLPVAQVGGDVVRARLSVSRMLPLRTSAAVCVIDVGAGLTCLTAFVLLGLALASVVIADPRVDRLALQLAGSGLVLGAGVLLGERLGVLHLVDRATARSEGALGELSGIGHEVEALFRRPARLARSMIWHLLSWSLGVLETWTALWAVGLAQSWQQAFVLESLAQGARALGFAVPGALGVQEGGYLLICSALSIPPQDALALSLIRRMRELSLGAVGLALWRFEPHGEAPPATDPV